MSSDESWAIIGTIIIIFTAGELSHKALASCPLVSAAERSQLIQSVIVERAWPAQWWDSRSSLLQYNTPHRRPWQQRVLKIPSARIDCPPGHTRPPVVLTICRQRPFPRLTRRLSEVNQVHAAEVTRFELYIDLKLPVTPSPVFSAPRIWGTKGSFRTGSI